MAQSENQLINYIVSKAEMFSNMLFLNDDRITTSELDLLSKFVNNIYVAFDSNLTIQSFLVKLRYNKNIHIISTSHIPSVSYDVFSSSVLDKKVSLILSTIHSIKYFYYSGFLTDVLDIPGFKNLSNNLYRKNDLDLIVNLDSFIQGTLTSELNKIVSSSNKNEKNLIKEIENQGYKSYLSDFKDSNFKWFKDSDNSEFLNNKNIKIDNHFKLIRIKQISPSNNIFNFFEQNKKIVYGKLDIFCNIKTLDDVSNLQDFIKSFEYDYFKFFIFMNGISYSSFDEICLNNPDTEFFKFSERIDDEIVLKMFNMLSDGEYKVNFKKGSSFINSLEFLR